MRRLNRYEKNLAFLMGSECMALKYLQIQPESALPQISFRKPFRAVVIVEDSVTANWQAQVSAWLVHSGCLFMMAWGEACSSWDDSVDIANLEDFDFGDIPDDQFVMTTWHENQTLNEVFWFSKHCSFHSTT